MIHTLSAAFLAFRQLFSLQTKVLGRYVLAFLIAAMVLPAAQAQEPKQENTLPQDSGAYVGDLDKVVQEPDKPLYSPFTARYILDEVRHLRMDYERSRANMLERQVTREYEIAKDAAGYARNAVELFFFVITAVTTLLVFFGWNSLRDIRSRVSQIAEARVESLIAGYAERMDAVEAELKLKSKRLIEAQSEIDETNEIHSLWLRASQETAASSKIAIYDEILKMRPEDTEAMTFKADSALQMAEPQWALSLANRALVIDPDNAHAFYQRACAHTAIGSIEEAIADLETAVSMADTYRAQAASDPAFNPIKELEAFRALTERDDGKS
ncbi:TPR end-of-group domain-containing protein [Hirschia baltica]|uniref:TPR repeat-containing protein n=1 Tax=Hirschia baltica (strain ATCC 49814 / DSM 5838 / IFAM 1418) TaxID=582402 RepID=C6XQF9_HIRBI|nr:hypothetical protein [Hirschia baltica]ACT60458.1 TPR repeat-containing protein [Hirschia baltica ATCC 49814]